MLGLLVGKLLRQGANLLITGGLGNVMVELEAVPLAVQCRLQRIAPGLSLGFITAPQRLPPRGLSAPA